jgi:hypothetical protein
MTRAAHISPRAPSPRHGPGAGEAPLAASHSLSWAPGRASSALASHSLTSSGGRGLRAGFPVRAGGFGAQRTRRPAPHPLSRAGGFGAQPPPSPAAGWRRDGVPASGLPSSPAGVAAAGGLPPAPFGMKKDFDRTT